MRKFVLGIASVLALAGVFAFAQPSAAVEQPVAAADKINWMTWEQAMTAMEKSPKKVFIDVYTDWCGWCKRMDAGTFTDPAVIAYMNANYYAVKFDAEGQQDLSYRGTTYSYEALEDRRGVHRLAVVLLNGRMGYPSFVYLNERKDNIKVSPGYKTPDVLLAELKSVAEN